MKYEEEQKQFSEELQRIVVEIKELEEIFSDPAQTEAKIKASSYDLDLETYSRWLRDAMFNPYSMNMSVSNIDRVIMQRHINALKSELSSKQRRKEELKRLLSQTPEERVLDNVKKGIKKAIGLDDGHNNIGCGRLFIFVVIIFFIILFSFK